MSYITRTNRQRTRVAAFVCLHTSWAIGNADKSTGWSGEGYEGWNEVCFDAGIDYRDNRDKLEALVVVLPTGKDNLCALDKNVAQDIDTM